MLCQFAIALDKQKRRRNKRILGKGFLKNQNKKGKMMMVVFQHDLNQLKTMTKLMFPFLKDNHWDVFFPQTHFGFLSVNLSAVCHPHGLKRERRGLLHYGLMPGCVEWGLKESERGRVWLIDDVEVSVMRWSSTLVNVSPCTRPSCFEEQSCVYQSQCVLASSTNFLVLTCPAKCGHCARHSESGMALGMMSLQNSHLTHVW